VEKLFALPGRLLQSRYIHDDYSANLIVRASDAESFDMLGDNGVEPDLALEQVPGAKEFQEPLPPATKETRKGRKRKNAEEEEPVESAYSKRQAELAAAVEEDARMEREKAERLLEKERNASDHSHDRTQEPGTPVHQERTGDNDDWLQQQTPSHQGDPAQPFPDQTPGHESYYGGGGATPAYSDYNPGGETPGYGGGASQPPLYPPTASPLPQDFPSTPVNGLATPHIDHQDESDNHDQVHPGLPQGPQHDFTDQWVSQAATATATGAALPPPRTPAHEPDDWEDNRPASVNDGRITPEDDDYEEEEEEEEGENEYLDEETVEQFEDRVLNKRAAQLHCRLRQRMVETPVLAFSSITKRKDTRKIAAQKFYSLLVLQKFMAVELAQEDVCYGEMQVSRGKQFELDTSKVKAK